MNWNSSSFNPPYNPQEDYIVMAFLTDYQGNILDTAGRPLSSFQADPLPKLAYDPAALTWNFGTAPVGTLIKQPLALANTGFGALSIYLGSAPGLTLSRRAEQVGGADLSNYELQLSTGLLPVGAYDQSVTIATSDPAKPLLALRVLGTVTAASGDNAGGTVQRPLDVFVAFRAVTTWASGTNTPICLGQIRRRCIRSRYTARTTLRYWASASTPLTSDKARHPMTCLAMAGTASCLAAES